MNNRDDFGNQKSQRDLTIDISQTNVTSFPTITKPGVVLRLNASRNMISNLPDMDSFARLRYLDLSQNNLQDVSPLASLTSLLELDISFNHIIDINFIQNLISLEILHASNNELNQIGNVLPERLIELDLSNNMLNSLDFLDSPNVSNDPFPFGLEKLIISGNNISEIINLRYITVFSKLRELDVGLLDEEENRNLQLLPFVKSLCPTIQIFDETDMTNVDELAVNPEDLIQVLTSGSEQALRDFISDVDVGIKWDEPVFIEFDDDSPMTPLKNLESRVRSLEEKVDDESFSTPVKGEDHQIGTLLSPYGKPDDNQLISSMQHDIAEMKQQIAQIAKLLYVHDCALRQIWDQ